MSSSQVHTSLSAGCSQSRVTSHVCIFDGFHTPGLTLAKCIRNDPETYEVLYNDKIMVLVLPPVCLIMNEEDQSKIEYIASYLNKMQKF